MKKLSFLAVMLFVVNVLFAIPADPNPVEFTQPDGKTLTIRIMGDERIHWAQTMDEYSLVFNSEGYLTYASLSEYNHLIPTAFIATDIDQRSEEVKQFLQKTSKNLFFSEEQVSLFLKVWEFQDEEYNNAQPMDMSKGVEKKMICAFANFPDKMMIKEVSEFEAVINQIGNNSVRDYFLETSYNKVDVHLTLFGPYLAPQTKAYYAGSGGTQNCQALARWLAQQVANEPGMNFNQYSSNGVTVDGFHFIFAGRGQESTGNAADIWSHKSQIWPVVVNNGVSINVYSCSPELRSATTITSIGVICHEMTHGLGAPDFYDTDYAGSGGDYNGAGAYCLMASGCYNSNGTKPSHVNMYQKVRFGWVTPTVLSDPIYVKDMPNSVENMVGYRINTGVSNDYFILENRQKVKFDANIPGIGLLIWHIHPSIGSAGNCINCGHPLKMHAVAAGCTHQVPTTTVSSYGNMSSSGTPYGNITGNNKTEWTDNTTPWGRPWTGAEMDKPLTGIANVDKLVSFSFKGAINEGVLTNILGSITVIAKGNNISIVNPENLMLQNIELFDVYGRVVYQTQNVNNSFAFTQNSANGIYFVRVMAENGKTSTTKIFLNK